MKYKYRVLKIYENDFEEDNETILNYQSLQGWKFKQAIWNRATIYLIFFKSQ